MNTLELPPTYTPATRTALAYLMNIRSYGLKSGDFQHGLDRVNIFVGRSASGKTARLDAIRLALNGGTLLGRASDLKSRTQDIMDLARDGEIEVMAEDDQGRQIHRRWVRGKNCQIIKQEIPQTPPILLDSSEYFALSDAKKIEKAFELCQIDSPEFSREAIVAELRNIRLDHNTKETEEAIKSVLVTAVGTSEDSDSAGEPVQQWLGDLIKSLKCRLSAAKASAERMTQTVQGITALAPEQAPKNVEAELKAERQKLGQLQTGLMWLEKQKAEVESLIERRAQIEKQILDLRDHPEVVTETQLKISEAEAEIERIESGPLSLPADLAAVDVLLLQQYNARLEAAINEIKAKNKCCAACGQFIATGITERQDAISKNNALIVRCNTAKLTAGNERAIVLRQKRFHLQQHRQYLEGLQNIAAKRAQAEARLSELSLDGKPSVEAVNLEILEAIDKRHLCENRITELDRKQRAFIAYKADEQRNAQALIEHSKARAEVDVTKAAIEKLEQVQAEMVAAAFESLLVVVNQITDGVIREPIQYRDGEIGRWLGATWIKHESFSGTEKALTYAGISLALAKDAPVKILLLDELARLDPVSLGRFIKTIIGLVDGGAIGQFCGCLSADYMQPGTVEGVNVIKV